MAIEDRYYMSPQPDDIPSTPLPPITNTELGYNISNTCWRCDTTGVTLVPDPMVRDNIYICGPCAGKRHRVKELYFATIKFFRKGKSTPPILYNENNPPL